MKYRLFLVMLLSIAFACESDHVSGPGSGNGEEPGVCTPSGPNMSAEVRFATHITRRRNGADSQQIISSTYDPSRIDTVGMLRPFSISYHGITTNGLLEAYRFFPIGRVVVPGAGLWIDDLADTVRAFATGSLVSDAFEPDLFQGTFRLAAQTRDCVGLESSVDAAGYTTGVCQVVVNFEPETEIYQILNTRFRGGQNLVEPIDFGDAVPDTVAMGSWITFFYRGWDSPFDSSLCTDDVNRCITYQKSYSRGHAGIPGAFFTSGWLPDTPEDTNPLGTDDSTSMNAGTVGYDISVRSVDEYGKADGTPASVDIVGNFNPTLDLAELVNYDGTVVGEGDTLRWDWWNPANTDTLDPSLAQWRKEFFMVVRASGHDHPKDPATSGVKSWRWFYRNASTGVLVGLGLGTGLWVDVDPADALQDTFTVIFQYPLQDIGGFNVDFPDYVNQPYDLRIRGRDTAGGEEFTQLMILNGARETINQYSIAALGRTTTERKISFFFAMTR